MSKVSESIWSGKTDIIPMADVQNIEKVFDRNNDGKRGSLKGIKIITKHTKYDDISGTWANAIWLGPEDGEIFIKDWCFYRFELEDGSAHFHGPEERIKI